MNRFALIIFILAFGSIGFTKVDPTINDQIGLETKNGVKPQVLRAQFDGLGVGDEEPLLQADAAETISGQPAGPARGNDEESQSDAAAE